MKKYYFVTTEHLEESLWFRDAEDFRAAMNQLAALAASRPEVIVLSFILMSNHVHFVLKGSRQDVLDFVNQFKRRYSLYMNRRWGTQELLRRNGLDVREILVGEEEEALEKVIAYVLMNCVAAGICTHPCQYPWCSGSMLFNAARPSGKPVSCWSARARKKLFHSDYRSIPEGWLVGNEGFILPQEYVDGKAVEALFRSPQRLNYFLMNSSKAKKKLEQADDCLPAFRDQTILQALPDLLKSLFRKRGFQELTAREQEECVRQIRYRFSANVNQIARVCGVSYADAARLLDSA